MKTTMVRSAALAAAAVMTCAAFGCSSSSDAAAGREPGATSGAGAGAAGGAASDATAPAGGPRYVLVNGAFLGAWSWDGLASRLAARGAKVTAVELPAHGTDTTPVSGATLDAYVAKVEAAIDASAADGPVVLVGHSLAGVVISQVAEERPDRIAKLVYVAAFVPHDGQSAQDLASTDAASHFGPALVIDAAHGTASIALDQLQDVFCADCAPGAIATMQAKYRDEPAAPLGAKAHLTDASFGRVPKFYVYTKQDHAISWALQQTMTAGATFQDTATLDVSHAPFLSKPDDLAAAILGFSSR